MTTSTPTTTRPAAAEPAPETIRSALASSARPPRPSALSTSLTFGWRALLKIKHVPEQLFDVTMFPIMFTLMFTYLFGGALAGSTQEYIQFLLPGILVQTVVMITMYTGMALNNDIKKGMFDRFQSLPIWRPSVLVGALLGDAFRYSIARDDRHRAGPHPRLPARGRGGRVCSRRLGCCSCSRSASRGFGRRWR